MTKQMKSLAGVIIAVQCGRVLRERNKDRRRGKGNWFTWDEYAVVASIAALIVPSGTDGRRAKGAQLVTRLDRIMACQNDEWEENRYAAGLIAFDRLSQRRYRKEFVFLEPASQQELLEEVDQLSQKLRAQGGTIQEQAARAVLLAAQVRRGAFPAIYLFETLREAVLAVFYSSPPAWEGLSCDAPPFKGKAALVFKLGRVEEFLNGEH